MITTGTKIAMSSTEDTVTIMLLDEQGISEAEIELDVLSTIQVFEFLVRTLGLEDAIEIDYVDSDPTVNGRKLN